jgi:hypothetical protein
MAAIRYFYNRIHNYQLEWPEKETKLNTVKNILHNHQYNTNILKDVCCKKRKRNRDDENILTINIENGLFLHILAKELIHDKTV